jgi:hypothetical protein
MWGRPLWQVRCVVFSFSWASPSPVHLYLPACNVLTQTTRQYYSLFHCSEPYCCLAVAVVYRVAGGIVACPAPGVYISHNIILKLKRNVDNYWMYNSSVSERRSRLGWRPPRNSVAVSLCRQTEWGGAMIEPIIIMCRVMARILQMRCEY